MYMAKRIGRSNGAPETRVPSASFPLRTSLRKALAEALRGFLPLQLASLVLNGATILLALPALSALFRLVLAASGLPRISDQNLGMVLAHPVALLLMILLVVAALAVVSLQLVTLIVLVHRQQCALPLQLRPVVEDVTRAIRAVVHYQSPLLIVYVLLVMPLGGFGLFSTVTRGIAVPLFISGEMLKAPVSAALYGTLLAVLLYVNLRLIFTFPLLVIEGISPGRAVAGSLAATRRQSWRIAAAIGIVAAGAGALSTLLTEAVVFAAALADRFAPPLAPAVAAGGYGIANVGSAVVLSFALVVILHALTAAYNNRRAGLPDGAPAPAPAAPEPHPRGRSGRRQAALVALGLTVMGATAVQSASILPAAGSVPADSGSTKIIAHRGFVGGGVENTIGALEAAARVQPDFVEIDAQETRDGRFILSHDVNLWIVSGLNVNTYELTLAEAEAIDVRVGGYSDSMVSLIDYVLRAEELGVKLLIELKLHGHESPQVVDRLLAELDSIGATGHHIYHSLSSEVVQELEEKRPGLRVGYTVAANVGTLEGEPGDFLVVEQSFFTEELAALARGRGKELWVWTVNDPDAIRTFLRVPVDGIITDRPDVVQGERKSIDDERGSAPGLRDALDELSLL
ncbi:glycerophosphodiester phosphodiesterase [Arthrobacter crusticola]|nr:glycerophosphodiester phosphodiesterase [Arthrobacter crusticola]